MNKIVDPFQAEVYQTAAYRDMHSVLMPFPILIDVEPSSACNLDCLFCARQVMTRPPAMLPLAVLKQVVDEMRRHRPTSLRFSGWGEPTLNPEIVEFVRYARASGILVHLTTNATLLSRELGLALLQAGLNKIKFSLQGLTAREYERMRRPRRHDDPRCGYAVVERNIETFVENRNLLSAPCHVQVSVSMLKNEQQEPGLQQAFFDRWYPLADSIWGLGKVGVYGGKPLLTSFQRAKESGRVAAVDLRQGRPLRQLDVNRGKKCSELYNKLSISAQGVIKACCDDYDDQLALGRVGVDSIEALWQGRALKGLRLDVESGEPDRVPRFCQGCDNYM
ncbi:MAG: radical SAM protein [Thermodesulfobacteriota bacterium]